MKGRRCFVMLLCLLLTALAGRAESDIENMSLEELYELRDRVNAQISELEQADDDQRVFESGVYRIGSDIPAGDYVVVEYEDAVFANAIIRKDAAEDSGMISHHLINGQAVIHLDEGLWLALSEARAYPLRQATAIEGKSVHEGGYLAGYTLAAGKYIIEPLDRAPLSSYSIFDGILGTGAQLVKFELLHDAAEVVLEKGDYIEFSGCTLSPLQ